MKDKKRYVWGLLAALVCLGLCSVAAAQAQETTHYTIENTHYRQLKSKHTGHNHELIVSLPADYASSPDKTYPVFYYLDAYWDTPLLSAIYGNLRYDNVIPEMIMVGLSYPGTNANYGQQRRRDFTPTQIDSTPGLSGGAPQFLAFLKSSVVPLVESSYRVDKTNRGLGGVSLGGLFTLYAMYDDPAFFSRYIAISPAVTWDNEQLADVDAQFAKDNKHLKARLFLSLGTDEYAPFRRPIETFQEQLAARDYHGLALQNYQMVGLRHTGVKADGYTRGLMWVWQDLAPKGPSGLEKDYHVTLEPEQPTEP